MATLTCDYDKMYKLVIIGDSGVGKSSLLTRYTENIYSDAYISTIGVDFKVKTVVRNQKTYKLQIWDTAGQERFRAITTTYYRGAHCCIVAFDITNHDTFDSVSKWILEIVSHAHDKILIILVGTKCEMIADRCVNYDEAMEFAIKHDIKYVETSAAKNTNITFIFDYIIDELKAKENRGMSQPAIKGMPRLSTLNSNSRRISCCS